MSEKSKALDWGMEEAEDNGFVLLEPGTYRFRVVKFERGYFQGSAKVEPCPKANLRIEAEAPHGKGSFAESIMLTESMAWKIAKFFNCIGAPKNAAGKTVVDWSKVEGAEGCAVIGVREYAKSDGSQGRANQVEEWLAPDDPRCAEAMSAPDLSAYDEPAAASWSM